MVRLVSQPGDIDSSWLTDALCESGALPSGRVIAAERETIGTGKMGDNVRYRLSYEGAPSSAPASVVAKLPASDDIARMSSAAQGSYWREVNFYREVAPRIPMRTPRTFVALVDDNQAEYVILMEDLAPAEPGDQIAGCDPQIAELALREAARLHGPLFGANELANFDWVVQTTRDGADLGRVFLSQMWPGFVERFGEAMSPEGIRLAERFLERFTDWAIAYDGPRTLVHADYRLENMLFGDRHGGSPITVVDWQSCSHSCALVDVSYFLGGGLAIADRRDHERELVEIYRRELASFGIDLAEKECWGLYRHYALHGTLITVLGSMLSGQDERGDRMFVAMIERHLQHALDLDCGDLRG